MRADGGCKAIVTDAIRCVQDKLMVKCNCMGVKHDA